MQLKIEPTIPTEIVEQPTKKENSVEPDHTNQKIEENLKLIEFEGVRFEKNLQQENEIQE